MEGKVKGTITLCVCACVCVCVCVRGCVSCVCVCVCCLASILMRIPQGRFQTAEGKARKMEKQIKYLEVS